jgi:hypothetical protein
VDKGYFEKLARRARRLKWVLKAILMFIWVMHITLVELLLQRFKIIPAQMLTKKIFKNFIYNYRLNVFDYQVQQNNAKNIEINTNLAYRGSLHGNRHASGLYMRQDQPRKGLMFISFYKIWELGWNAPTTTPSVFFCNSY